MYNSDQGGQDGSQTAFRAAEKRYQLHREQIFRNRGGRRVSKGFAVRPTDLSDVLNLHAAVPLPEGVACHSVPSGMPPTAAAFTFAAHPGLLLVRGALPPSLQRQLVVEALTCFCEPPSHTNHTKAYPAGLPGIWHAAQQALRLQLPAMAAQKLQLKGMAAEALAGEGRGGAASTADAVGAGGEATASPNGQGVQGKSRAVSATTHSLCSGTASSSGTLPLWGTEGSGPQAQSLLRKLRWATLGPPYDWTLRKYLHEAPHMPLPEELCQLAVTLADLAVMLAEGSGSGSGSTAVPDGEQGSARLLSLARTEQADGNATAFCPNAALINYYYEGDTLNGHLDDAEPSLEQPLVALSLGCAAVFLMGAPSKDVPPTALLLRSGDAVVLAGQARRCHHGVPRVLTETDWPFVEGLPMARDGNLGSGAIGGMADSTSVGSSVLEGGGEGDAFAAFAHHLQHCRINISIRDVR